jgi:hypothetical protein
MNAHRPAPASTFLKVLVCATLALIITGFTAQVIGHAAGPHGSAGTTASAQDMAPDGTAVAELAR